MKLVTMLLLLQLLLKMVLSSNMCMKRILIICTSKETSRIQIMR